MCALGTVTLAGIPEASNALLAEMPVTMTMKHLHCTWAKNTAPTHVQSMQGA